MHCHSVTIAADAAPLAGTLAVPATGVPGVLFVHGWSGSQENDLKRAQELAALGCMCLTFDLRGHVGTQALRDTVTPRDNLEDALAAYDLLCRQPSVDRAAIAVIGSSYGAYLATVLSTLRPVRWLSLRVPALYRDQHWEKAKGKLDRIDLSLYRGQHHDARGNRALAACADFAGDVLVVESEHDDLVPHTTIASYLAAFGKARSLTHRIISGADHALSRESCRLAYTGLLVRWVREMVLGAR